MNAEAQSLESVGNSELSVRDKYEDAITRSDHHNLAKHTAEKVLNKIFGIRPDSRSNDVMEQIQEASRRNDSLEIIRLSKILESQEAEQSSRLNKLTELKSEFSFADLLAAYKDDVQELAYDLAYMVLEGTQHAIENSNKSGKASQRAPRTPRVAKSYIISKGDQTLTAAPNTGRPAAPGTEREFFEFFGFAVSEDGKTLEPSSFVDAEGQQVTVVSKKAIINDLLAENSTWAKKGYSIREAEALPDESAQSDAGQADGATPVIADSQEDAGTPQHLVETA